jgi:hypothetical protein
VGEEEMSEKELLDGFATVVSLKKQKPFNIKYLRVSRNNIEGMIKLEADHRRRVKLRWILKDLKRLIRQMEIIRNVKAKAA